MTPHPSFSKYILLGSSLLLSTSLTAVAQLPTSAQSTHSAFFDVAPHLPGTKGTAAIIKAIQQRFIYPKQVSAKAESVIVFVSFTVAADGAVRGISIPRGFRPDYDSAVVDAVRRLPVFESGKLNNRDVAVPFTLRIIIEP